MGILLEKIKTGVINKAEKGADAISKLSKLSPAQVDALQEKREEYLTQMPSADDEAAAELTTKLLASTSVEVFNSYLNQIKDIYLPVEISTNEDEEKERIWYFDITKWVTDKKENSLEKLVNVYQVLDNKDCNIALVFRRTNEACCVYLGVRNNSERADRDIAQNQLNRIKTAIKGNFPGSQTGEEKQDWNKILNVDKNYSVATVSNIPSEKSEKFISQTIEKLLDGIVPDDEKENYTVVLLATPVHDVENRKTRLGEIYSAFAPYASWQTGYTFTESDAINSNANFGVNVGVGAGIQKGESTSESVTSCLLRKIVDTARDKNINGWKDNAKAQIDNVTKNKQNTIGVSQGASAGVNAGMNFARSSSVTATVGKNETITQSFTNYNIKHLLESLEKQMKRIDVSSALGMWDFAAYVVSEDDSITNNVAHMYEALTQGEESFMSHTAINTWRGADPDSKISGQAKEIFKYIRSFQHPVFALNQELIELDPTFLVYPLRVTPTTTLTGKELAYSLNFPAKSVSGFPVLECASFGRSISTYDLPEKSEAKESKKMFDLGKIWHMNNEESLPVQLNPNLLTSHVFITGSTGSGKSNTVYQLLNEAKEKGTKFLVIEPAKGEYKNVFGGDGVTVYGTNPNISGLLKINPFSFPIEKVHVLEHMDRLVEIFNVCWPMYAAMPAVLKEAIEKSYEDAGWDLIKSENPNGKEFPTFADVAQNIKIIIDTSEYDAENKGAYKGSLLTRLKSLTNGLNGLIFSSDEIADSDLFDKNVIIDLSRVGSQETKALLMGVLVLKLQEYRMSSSTKPNAELNHITVLEEAHNLLKRTSTEQSAESANLAGKSVEMLTNAIAEMRTYGEAFFIVDQAPALLDMAVIRNTNTKIIMRLPDLGDRELVGKAANLNDDQITELAKLPTGVAAVYQNQWVEAVLCKVINSNDKSAKNVYEEKPASNIADNKELNEKRIYIASLLSNGEKLSSAEAVKELKPLNISYAVKAIAMEYLSNPPAAPKMTKLAPVMAALFPKAYAATKTTYAINQDNPALWTNDIVNALNRYYWNNKENMDQVQRDVVQALVTQYVFNEIHQVAKLEEWTKHHGF